MWDSEKEVIMKGTEDQWMDTYDDWLKDQG